MRLLRILLPRHLLTLSSRLHVESTPVLTERPRSKGKARPIESFVPAIAFILRSLPLPPHRRPSKLLRGTRNTGTPCRVNLENLLVATLSVIVPMLLSVCFTLQ